MPNGLNMNWSELSFNAIIYTKVTGGEADHGGSIVTFSGDAQVFVPYFAVGVNNPTFSFHIGDVGAAENLAIGASGALIAKLNDFEGVTLGGVEWTVATAVVRNIRSAGQHAQVAGSTIDFLAISPDGTTNPVTISRF